MATVTPATRVSRLPSVVKVVASCAKKESCDLSGL
jgi:hypothetical protein